MRTFLLVLFTSLLILTSCSKDASKETDANESKTKEEEISDYDLLNKTGIAVEYNNLLSDKPDTWRVVLRDDETIAYMNALKQLPGGDAAFKAWMGDDDISVLEAAFDDGFELGVELSFGRLLKGTNVEKLDYKKQLALKGVDDYIQASEKVESTLDAWIETTEFFYRSNNASSETMKILTYAVFSESTEDLKFGHWKYILLPYEDRELGDITGFVYFHDGGLLNAEDNVKTSFFKRIRNEMRLRNGFNLAELHSVLPVVKTDNSRDEGIKVQQNLRNLIYDIYLVVNKKEPLIYPDYSKALVSKYYTDLKAFETKEKEEKTELFNELSRELKDISSLVNEEDTSKLIGTDDEAYPYLTGGEGGTHLTYEYKGMLKGYEEEKWVIYVDTVDLNTMIHGDPGKMDIIQLRDAVLGVLYNDLTLYEFDHKLYNTVEEARKDAATLKIEQPDKILSSSQAEKLVKTFYEHIINQDYKSAYNLIGTPWRNKMDYQTFASGYSNTTAMQFWVIRSEKVSDNHIKVTGGLDSDTETKDTLTKQKFEVEYDVVVQNNTFVISEGKGKVLLSNEMPLNEDKWTIEQWDNATLENRLYKIARTWERHGYNPRGNGVLVSVSMLIDDKRDKIVNNEETVESMIINSFDSPELSNYDPTEKCEKELPDGWGC